MSLREDPTVSNSSSLLDTRYDRSVRMLICEADSGIAIGLTARLSEAKFDTFACSTTSEAIKQVNSQAFDVIILDIELREQEGIGTLTRLRSLCPLAVIIIYTNDTSYESVQSAINLGASGYIEKSSDIVPLVELVKRKLESPGSPLSNGKAHSAEAAQIHQQSEIDLVSNAHCLVIKGFVSEFSHQLNQPLFAISNFAQACLNCLGLTTNDQADDILQSLQQIVQQTARASDITRDFRGRISTASGNLIDIPERLDINQLIQEITALARVDVRCPGVHVQLELQDDLPEIVAAKVVIEQVLFGCIVNALNAMCDEACTVRRLTVKTLSESSNEIEIRVSDTGSRMRNDSQNETDGLEEQFGFFVMPTSGGPALSLGSCRFLVKSHDGKIWVSTAPTQGNTIHLVLLVNR